MRKCEHASANRGRSRRDGDTSEPITDRVAGAEANRWLWVAAVLPIIVCLIAVLAVLVWTGLKSVEPAASSASTLQYVGEVLGNGDSYLALIVGGAGGLLTAVIAHWMLGGCGIPSALRYAGQGSMQMLPAFAILWFAWALSDMTEQLGTGAYLASVVSDQLSPPMLPTVVFLIAGVVAFSTGTSWGTMGILTPLSIALAFELDPAASPSNPVVLATCGSVLAGAIFGDHCSPISDTTVLSSRASGCDHVSHVRTQMPYAVVVAILCVLVGTIPAPWGLSPWLSLVIGLVAVVFVVQWFGRTPSDDLTA